MSIFSEAEDALSQVQFVYFNRALFFSFDWSVIPNGHWSLSFQKLGGEGSHLDLEKQSTLSSVCLEAQGKAVCIYWLFIAWLLQKFHCYKGDCCAYQTNKVALACYVWVKFRQKIESIVIPFKYETERVNAIAVGILTVY